MKSLFESAAAIFGSLTLAALFLSISHEYGYFLIVGLHFQALLTTTDYLANGIIWLPLAIIVMYGAIDFRKLKDQPNKDKRDWKNWKEWIWPILVAITFMASLLFTRWPPGTLSLYYWIGVVVFVWSRIWRTFLPQSEVLIDKESFELLKLFVRIGPPAFIALILMGSRDAVNDLEQTTDTYILHIKNEKTPKLRVFLRGIDKGILLRNTIENRVEFRRWSEIDLIEKPARGETDNLACAIFGWCAYKKTPPLP